jgi:hypothetical protein
MFELSRKIEVDLIAEIRNENAPIKGRIQQLLSVEGIATNNPIYGDKASTQSFCYESPIKRIHEMDIKTSENNSQPNKTIFLHNSKSGNKIGHDPKAPRQYLRPIEYKQLRPFNRILTSKCSQFYTDPTSNLAFLNLAYHGDKMTKHFVRKRRSELREAIGPRFLMALSNHINDKYGQAGRYTQGLFTLIDTTYVLGQTGMSRYQLYRVMKILKKAGYLVVHPMYSKEKGCRMPAQLELTPLFYQDLGIDIKNIITRTELMMRHPKHAFLEKCKSKHVAKKHIDLLNETLKRAHSRQPTENDALDTPERLPGSERRRETKPLYPDYTGISERKNRPHTEAPTLNKPAASHISNIILNIVDTS